MRPPLGLGVRSLPPVDQFAFRLAGEAHPHRQDFGESVISWSHPTPGLWIMQLRLPRRDVGLLQSALLVLSNSTRTVTLLVLMETMTPAGTTGQSKK
jgi:hypothetical protein